MNGSIGWQLQCSGCSNILTQPYITRRVRTSDETRRDAKRAVKRREVIARSFLRNVIAFGEHKRIPCDVSACSRPRASNTWVYQLCVCHTHWLLVRCSNEWTKFWDLTPIEYCRAPSNNQNIMATRFYHIACVGTRVWFSTYAYSHIIKWNEIK